MRARAPYTECKIYYDGLQKIDVGHFLKTPAGSAYRIQSMRQDGKREYRRHLVCLRWPVNEIPVEAIVHPLHWYSRTKKRAKTLAQYRGAA